MLDPAIQTDLFTSKERDAEAIDASDMGGVRNEKRSDTRRVKRII